MDDGIIPSHSTECGSDGSSFSSIMLMIEDDGVSVSRTIFFEYSSSSIGRGIIDDQDFFPYTIW